MGAGKDRVDSPNARRSCEEQFTQYVSAFLVLTSLISGRINSYLFSFFPIYFSIAYRG